MGRYNRNLPPANRAPIQESAKRGFPLRPGQVVTTHGRTVVVEDARGILAKCSLRRKLGRAVCGDKVLWRPTTHNQGVVESIDRGHGLLERRGAGGHHKPLAANVDQIIITSASHPPLSENLIDSYLVAAELIGAESVILINKSDLLDEQQQAGMAVRLKDYFRIGYPVLFCNTRLAHGTDELVESLQERTSIFVGQSGVGKSSLIRSLLPDQKIRISKLSSATGLGRHTTSNTTLYHLSANSHLIDSPGVRDFQLWQVAPNQVADGFREFQHYLGQCRFHNCLHRGEPGCAIQAAVDKGDVSERRLKSYRKLAKRLEEK
ncbi:MAG: ribosome small subunit-dependent GTPase A [Gammaproteobacteria bacterium]